MTDHKWRKDRDGAESCEREGCAVRKFGKKWQRRPRGRWELNCVTTPIPPCVGKEAEVKPAPAPLEDLRNAVLCRWETDEQEAECRAALATLEESIRADELAMAITLAEDDANNHPLVSTSMRLRVRLSKLRGKAESLEKWEASIRKDERSKAATVVDGYARRETKVSVRAPLLAAAADIRGTK